MALEDILKNLSLGTPGPTRRGRVLITTAKPYTRSTMMVTSRFNGMSEWRVAAVEARNTPGRECKNVARRRGGPPTHLEQAVPEVVKVSPVAVQVAPAAVEAASEAAEAIPTAAEAFARLRLKAPVTRVGRKTAMKVPYARPAAAGNTSSYSKNVARRSAGPPTNMELKAAVAVVSRIFGRPN